MYSKKAQAERRCKATRRDGNQCGNYARHDSNVCGLHLSPRRKYPKKYERILRKMKTLRDKPSTMINLTCDCRAYRFKHRAGGGLCRWPEEPILRLTSEPGVFTGNGRLHGASRGRSGKIEVADPDALLNALREAGIDPSSKITPEMLEKLGHLMTGFKSGKVIVTVNSEGTSEE